MQAQASQELVSRLKSGNQEAFGELYRLFRPRVYRFALKLLHDRDAADDIVQETFFRARRALETLEQSASLAAWLFSIARNEVYGILRRAKRNGQIGSEEDVWEDASTHEGIVASETTEIVQAMIAKLKPEYREAIILREYEQLSYAEIAKITGDSESAVKSRLFKARKVLLKKLQPYFGMKE